MTAFFLATLALADSPETASDPPETASVVPVRADALAAEIRKTSDRPRLYNFWATWCGPCVQELPEIRAFADLHPEVDVVLVNTDWPSAEVRKNTVDPFVHRNRLTTMRLLQVEAEDPAVALASAVPHWPDRIPVTLMVRPDGTVARMFVQPVVRTDLEEALVVARR